MKVKFVEGNNNQKTKDTPIDNSVKDDDFEDTHVDEYLYTEDEIESLLQYYDEESIYQRKWELDDEIMVLDDKIFFSIIIALMGTIITTIFLAIYLTDYDPLSIKENIIYLLIALYIGGISVIYLFNLYRYKVRKLEIKSEELELKFDKELIQTAHHKIERSAMILLKKNHFQLRRYYDINLHQTKGIFYLGIFCILLGVAVISGTLYLISSSSRAWEEKVVMGILGAVGGFLTNYVAAIYFKMHGAITESLTTFYEKLVTNHNLFLANVLVSKIDKQYNRDRAFENLAVAIAKKKD
jgi:hypothetical protein